MGRRRPLNILEVGSAFHGWGGTELHVLNLSEQLQARGHTVTVACRPAKYVEAECVKRGIATTPLTIRSQTDTRQAATLWKLLKNNHYDVVHAHWSPDYLVPATLGKFAHVPVVLMSHHSPHPFKNEFRRKLIRTVLYNRVIALSESVRQMLITSEKLAPEKVVTIHHGTNPTAFQHTTKTPEAVRAEWNLPPNAFVVGMAGRLAGEKGILYFLDALALLQKTDVGAVVHGVLIGDGPQEAELRAAVAQRELEHMVTFAGFRNDVNNAINALDALVLASTWAEPCAAVVQQAMALGKPVIGTDIGGTPEMIAGGETGLLVPPQNAQSLADAIRALHALTSAQRNAMGQAGRVRVETQFTLAGMVDKIEALYYREYALWQGEVPATALNSAPQPTHGVLQ